MPQSSLRSLRSLRMGSSPVTHGRSTAAAVALSSLSTALLLSALTLSIALDPDPLQAQSVPTTRIERARLQNPPVLQLAERTVITANQAARDTVLVLILGAVRNGPAGLVHIFSPIGAFLGTASRPSFRTVPDLYATNRGWILSEPLVQFRGPQPATTALADSVRLFGLNPGTFEQRSTHAFPNTPRYPVGSNLTLEPFMALVPTYVVATDGPIYTNTRGGYQIEVRSADGLLERRITGDLELTPVTEMDLAIYLSRKIATETASGRNDMVAALQNEGPRVGKAEHRPVLGQMVASRGGRLLVRRLDLEGDEAAGAPAGAPGNASTTPKEWVWDLLDLDQGLIGRLTLPADLTVGAFEWPYLYVVEGKGADWSLIRYRVAQRPRP